MNSLVCQDMRLLDVMVKAGTRQALKVDLCAKRMLHCIAALLCTQTVLAINFQIPQVGRCSWSLDSRFISNHTCLIQENAEIFSITIINDLQPCHV